MIHSLRRDRKAKAIAEVLAVIGDAHPPRAPHRPRPVLEADEWLFESATEFFTALENMPSALSKLRKRTNDKASLSAGGAQDQ